MLAYIVCFLLGNSDLTNNEDLGLLCLNSTVEQVVGLSLYFSVVFAILGKVTWRVL